MKIHTLICSALLALSLAACGEDAGKPISDLKDPSTTDSLLYYYAQLRAYQYWQEAVKDTNMRHLEERQEFLNGVEAGLKAAYDNNEYYNVGLRLGMRMAANVDKFEKRFDVILNPEIIMQSLRYGLDDRNEIDYAYCQSQFYRLVDEISTAQMAKNEEKVHRALIETARTNHLMKINHDLYYRIERKGSGPNAVRGDVVRVSVSYTRPDGSDLGMPGPKQVYVGAPGVAPVMSEAYSRLNKGAVGIFATSADDIFRSRASVLGFDPSEVIIVKITLNDIVSHGNVSLDMDSIPTIETGS